MSTAAVPATQTDEQLGIVFQYNLEAYKMFQKLAELLQNPTSAATFANFAEDERNIRDLLDIKYASSRSKLELTLGSDLRFQDVREGELSDRELAETLLGRERTMEKRLGEFARTASKNDRNLYTYIAATKRAHQAYLERELDLIQLDEHWFRREDGEAFIVHGTVPD